MRRASTRQSGDTIIEVLLAISVFSLVAIIALQVMNASMNAAQRAIEITLVRQQIDSQAEALRAIHESAARGIENSGWDDIKGSGTDHIDTSSGCPADQAAVRGAFALNPLTAAKLDGSWYQRAGSGAGIPPYAQVASVNGAYQAYGIWIERQYIDDGNPAAYNFRIQACWDDPSLSTPMTISTIVRLYDL